MTATMLALTVFCCVSGGPYGLEPVISAGGAGLGLLLILITPVVWALPDALTTAELASAIPEEGGYVIWVRRAMGPFWGFLCAWWTWLYTLVDAAIYPVLFTSYLSQLLKTAFGTTVLETNIWAKWSVAVVIVAAFTYLNIRGTRLVGKTSSAFALIIIAPFALLAIIGLARLIADPRPVITTLVPSDKSVPAALSAGLSTVMWNYLGWDALSTIAEEVDEPQRAYPRALLLGVPLVMLVYLLPTIAGLAYFPDTAKWEEGAWPEIARAVGGNWLGLVINVVGLVSPVALFTASVLGASRIPFVLAEARFLPKGLMAVHPRFGTPWKAILVCGVVYAVLAFQTFSELVSLNVIMYSAALMLEIGSLLLLRKKEPNLPRPFRIRGGWPILWLLLLMPFVLIVLLVTTDIMDEGWRKQIPTGIALVSGPIIYGLVTAWRGRQAARN